MHTTLSPLPHPPRWYRLVILMFWVSFAALLCSYAFLPLFDPDFWWHLKAGQTMIEQKGLLQQDPFAFAHGGDTTARTTFILKGYWLWQITAAGLYNLLGFNGVSLFNLMVAALLGLPVYYRFQRQKIDPLIAVLLICGGFLLLTHSFQLERPQTISFVFIALLLALLTRFEQNERLDWKLPLLMMLWANFHGGFLVGDIVLVLFAGGAVIQYRRQIATVKHVLLWTMTGVAASLLSPTGWLAFISFKHYNSSLLQNVIEYQSTLQGFEAGGYSVTILWVLIALYFAGVLLSRRVYWPEFLVAIFLSWFSFMHMRNIGLFVPAMLPVIGSVMQRAFSNWLPPRHSYVLRSLALLTGAGFLVWITTGFVERRIDQGAVRQVYPEQVISFLENSELQGHMFNDYEYGGYLLWRLAPRIKVFIDGRGLGEDVFADYRKIKSASQTRIDGRPEFDSLLSKYQVDFVVQQVYQGDGSIQPLMTELLQRDEWVPIYQDNLVYVLCRQTDKNAATIERYRIEKNEFKLRMSLLFNYLIRQSPGEVGYKIAHAGMSLYLGNLEQAREQIEQIRLLSPDEPALVRLKRDYNMLLGRLNRN
ncbi:MAG: hypothetical protein P1P74_12045 [Desulfuromonadales bacterium]|nr:hypothetical protein [Desulfuromonadales bacterium]